MKHIESPLLLYSVELLQAKQSVLLRADWKYPAAQRVHWDAARLSEKVPGRHSTHPRPPADDWNVPGRH